MSEAESYKIRHQGTFCGIVTESHDGVVDTGEEGGLIGSHALDRLLQHLRQVHGLRLRGKWGPKTSAAKGVGGQAKVNGILNYTVVDGEVPLLLSVRLMRTLKATISFLDHTFQIPEYDITIRMHELPSGHVTILVTQFENNQFQMPVNTPGCTPEDFRAPHVDGHHMLTTAMETSQSDFPNSNPESCQLPAASVTSIASLLERMKNLGSHPSRCHRGRIWTWDANPREP